MDKIEGEKPTQCECGSREFELEYLQTYYLNTEEEEVIGDGFSSLQLVRCANCGEEPQVDVRSEAIAEFNRILSTRQAPTTGIKE